jgi:hypothetical protein
MIEWLCTRERLNLKVVTIFTQLVATAGLKLAAAMVMRIRIIQRFTGSGSSPSRICD